MKLLTSKVRKLIPALYSTENQGGDALVTVKFFDPHTDWTWYVMEGDQRGDDFIFYGLIDGFEKEFGYFSLNEMKRVKRIERDIHWKPKPVKEIYPEFFQNDKNSNIWYGLEEIHRDKAIEIFKQGKQEVYGIDYDGYESVIYDIEDFYTFERFAIEKSN